MNTRLQQFLAAENISQAQLADTLEVARAGISHIISGRNKPSYDFLYQLMSRYPRLNIEWLMFGRGKMYVEPKEKPDVPQKAQTEASSLLFSDEDLYDISDTAVEIKQETPSTTEIKHLDTPPQIIRNQRNVKKIIILFDDGTFQEM